MTQLKGIDVSYVQGEQGFDFNLAKSMGYDFCIVRIGLTYYGQQELDEYFVRNINKAKEAGMYLGIYFYSTATTIREAEREAEWLIDTMHTYLDGVDLKAGVWYDVETESQQALGAQTLARIVMGFFNKMNEAGIYCGLYSYYSMLTYDLDVSMLPKYIPLWPANYKGRNYFREENTFKHTPIWQFSDSGNVGGVTVDENIMYENP